MSGRAEPADLITAFRGHAAADLERPILTWLADLRDPAAELTVGALDDAAAAVAAAMLARADPGDRVLLVEPPGLDFVVAFLGSLYAGCIPVPVYPMLDGEEDVRKVRRVLDDSGAVLAWTSDGGVADYVAHALATPTFWATGTERHRLEREPAPDSLAFLQYTSGSTADPRGVMVTHGNLAANLGQIREAFEHDRDSVLLSWLPAYHDMGLIGNILHPLHSGCHAYLASPIDFIRSPLSWLESIARYRVTTSGAPNFAYDLVLKAARREPLPAVSLATWRTAYCGAEPVSGRTLARFGELLAPHGFRHGAFVPCYGLAEATLLVTSRPIGGQLVTRSSPDGGPIVSCGVPRGCELAVVDEHDRQVADGEVGEILVRGPSVAAGYFRRPELSLAVFGAVPAERTGTWLRTGDLGFVADGELFVTGRIKDVIVVRGRNHHPQDLERLVAETCPVVRPGCVAAFASAAGDGAVVVAESRGGQDLDGSGRLALNALAASVLGLSIHEIIIVPKGTVPKTTSGKLRRAECRARFLAGDYDRYRIAARPLSAAPDDDTVRAVVREVLEADAADEEPLVARGLDSLRAVRLAELLLRRAGLDVPVRVLLRGITMSGLLELAGEGTATGGEEGADGRLSRAQESLLFLHMLDPGSDEYAISFALEPGPETDFAAFDAALRTALSWHPELAMRFAAEAEGWRRIPVAQRALRDALALNPIPVPEERLNEQLAVAAALPFDLDEGPLLRLYRWQTPARRVYQLAVHHAVTDLWSLCLLLRDIGACYAEHAGGRNPVRPTSVSYDSYVTEQRAYLSSAAARARDEELRALLPTRGRALDIRTDAPYQARRTRRAGQVRATAQVRRTAVQDPVAMMLALWAATLHRYGATVPIVIGVPITGRGSGRHGTISGLCTNTVPVALEPRPGQPLAQLVISANDQLQRGMDAPMYPLARAVEAVKPERVAGRHPLVETLITIHEDPMPDVPGVLEAISGTETEVELGRLRLRAIPVSRRACRYDLDLVITPRQDGYLLALEYASDLFTPASAESILATFQAAVVAAFTAAGPDVRLDDVLVLSERDKKLLVGISSCDTGPLDPPALARLRRLAEVAPDRPAIQEPLSTMGYGGFLAAVDRIAAAVHATGHPGAPNQSAADQVGLLLTSSADFAAAMFGAWAAGFGIVPLPAEYPDERLAYMLRDCRPRTLLTCTTLRARARALAAAAALDAVVLVTDELRPGELPAGPACRPPDPPPAAPAFTVYTSGSTGLPKGVLIRQDQISRLVAWSEREWRLGPWARIAQTLNLGFDFGLQELFTILSAGGCVAVPGAEDRRSAADYARFLRAARITILFTTPSYADELVAAGERLPDLRLVLFGGEVLRRATVAGWRALVGPHCRLYNGYGPTEATVNCLMYEIPWQVPDEGLPDVLPTGAATAASRIHLVDAADRPVPVGAIGEILIGGPGVADGYLNRPDLTASRFVTLDLDPGPLYRTGDRAYVRPGGGYVVIGRADRQVKVGGFRVELGEVEHVLRGAPGVTSVAVRVLGDPGELIAFAAGDRVDPGVVSRHGARLLSPAMMPARIVPLDRLPTTVNGKLDEHALVAAAAAARPPSLSGSASPAEVEKAICEIWAAALELSSVDGGANVFDLGAHSLIVTRVHGPIQASVGVVFPVQDLFEYPRPCDLARRITARHGPGGMAAPRIGQPSAHAKEEQ